MTAGRHAPWMIWIPGAEKIKEDAGTDVMACLLYTSLVTGVMILIFVCAALTLWVYRSVLRPLSKLQELSLIHILQRQLTRQ